MKLKARVLSMFMVAALVVTALSASVFASTRPNSIRLERSSVTLDPDENITIKFTVSPSDYDGSVEVKSSNTDVAWAGLASDDTIEINAYTAGTCTVNVSISGYSTSSTVSVTVKGTPTSSSSSTRYSDMTEEERSQYEAGLVTYRSESSRSTASSSASSKSSTAATGSSATTIELTEKASREEVIDAARTGKALKNYASVSAESLQAASGTVMFDTRADKSVVGRLSIPAANAQNMSGDILTGVYVGTGNTQKVQNTFDKSFSNDKKVILCDQKNFGANVTVTAKVGSLDADNLYFYSYDASTKKYSPITVSGAKKDKNNFLSFTTSTGGYIIVSDGKLSK